MSNEYELLEENVYGDMVAVLVSSSLLPTESRLWYNRKTSVIVRFYTVDKNFNDKIMDNDEKILELAQRVVEENK